MRQSLGLLVLAGVSALTLTACAGAPEDGLGLGASDPGRQPLEVDPGNRNTVSAGSTVLGTVEAVQSGSGNKTIYYALNAALPSGASSITLTAVENTSVPDTYTFTTSEIPYSSTSAPSASSTLFVDSTHHVGLVWGFSQTTGGSWTGSATWYHNSASNIALSPGTYTLTNNTADTALVYVAADSAP